jgi:excisionase family DNA binding protein
MQYRKWLRQELKALQAPPEPDGPFYEGLRSIVSEAGRRAAEAGLPDAVAACTAVRRGGVTADIVLEILAACLAACPEPDAKPPAADASLTVKQAAERFNIPARTLYAMVESGTLKHARLGQGRGTIRIKPVDLSRLLEGQKPAGSLYD